MFQNYDDSKRMQNVLNNTRQKEEKYKPRSKISISYIYRLTHAYTHKIEKCFLFFLPVGRYSFHGWQVSMRRQRPRIAKSTPKQCPDLPSFNTWPTPLFHSTGLQLRSRRCWDHGLSNSFGCERFTPMTRDLFAGPSEDSNATLS